MGVNKITRIKDVEVIGRCVEFKLRGHKQPGLVCGYTFFADKIYVYHLHKDLSEYIYVLSKWAKDYAALDVYHYGVQHETPMFHVCIAKDDYNANILRIAHGRNNQIVEATDQKHLRLEDLETLQLKNADLIAYLLDKFLD